MPKELNLSWLIRYGYGGGLLYLLLLIFNSKSTMKEYTDAVGSVLALTLILAAGTCIYVIYRHLVGEWFLYPVAHWVDWLTNKGNRDKQKGAVSTIWFLSQQGVPRGARREAYTALRREYLQPDTKKQLDLAHSEVHVLYITFLELFVAGMWLWHGKGLARGGWLALGAFVFLLAAWAADARLHRHEFRSIVPGQPDKRQGVLNFLAERGYVKQAS